MTRANRRKQWAKEQGMWESAGRVRVLARRTLKAWDGEGSYQANYVKKNGSWVFEWSNPRLEFLRYCGKGEDARRAMEKRGLSYQWI